ncbi:MAG: hypothetical protein IT210_02625 [Armatimonadetes bacterium]|nr:hypothetical protein [Armatimonadota bacterium]
MSLGLQYLRKARSIFSAIGRKEMKDIERAAEAAAKAVLAGRNCYFFDEGHMVPGETAPGIEGRPDIFAPLGGDADSAAKIRAGDVLVHGTEIGDGSVELAEAAQKQGATVVVICQPSPASRFPIVHQGKLASDWADIVVETYIPYTDGMIDVKGIDSPACPGSGIADSAAFWMIAVLTAEKLARAGRKVPVD